MSGISRRGIMMAGAGALAAPAALIAAGRRGAGFSPPKRPTLLKGGCIISMDSAVGDIARGDLLIDGKKIVAVGGDIPARDALVIDATNMIVLPGFVDTHRHAWEGQLRRLGPNIATLQDYIGVTHASLAQYYRPRDMYVGNLLSALGCINAGITCMIDNSHNSRSAAHSDMAVRALFDAGIRAVHASGAPAVGSWDKQWPQDLARLQKTFFSSDDQLVTLGMFGYPVPQQWAVARQLGLRIYGELLGAEMGGGIEQLAKAKLVGPDNCFNHCTDLPASTWAVLKDVGAQVDVCPRSDFQYALGSGIPAYFAALQHDMKPGFSIDNELSYGGDMFGEMHVAFNMQRAAAGNRKVKADNGAAGPVSVREVLACATVNGAACAGLSHKVGRLAPGMEADIVMLRTDGIDLYPSNNAIGTVVGAADRSNVDTVIIGGVVRKQAGRMIGVDMAALRRDVDESRQHLFAAAGYKPDLFADAVSIAPAGGR